MLVQTPDERCVARSVTCRRDESASPHCRGATWPKNEENCVFPVLMQRVTQGEKSGGKDFSEEKEGYNGAFDEKIPSAGWVLWVRPLDDEDRRTQARTETSVRLTRSGI